MEFSPYFIENFEFTNCPATVDCHDTKAKNAGNQLLFSNKLYGNQLLLDSKTGIKVVSGNGIGIEVLIPELLDWDWK